MRLLVSIVLCSLAFINAMQGQSSIKVVKGGKMESFISKKKGEKVIIYNFMMSDHAVTNAEYKEFVDKNPRWKKSSVSRLLADRNYLSHWTSDNSFPPSMAQKGVTNVSWHAAKAYCAWKGGTLPTNVQWEFALSKQHRSIKTGAVVSVNDVLLQWYANANPLETLGGIINTDGIKDLVGAGWEWTENFNELIINGDSRGNSNQESNLVCGSASLNSNDVKNYARFIRIAFRTSLKASTTTKNLGFRICYSHKEIAQ